MGFADAIESGFRRYADFNGRSSRSEYWCFCLFIVLFQLALGIARIIAVASGGDASSTVSAITVITYLVDLAFFLPSLAVFVRRMHDTDRSGWLFFIAFTLVGVIPLVIWLCTRGIVGENRFGPDPLPAGQPPAAQTDASWVS